jgi:Na+-transporting methylmalonyl-CoA/oxaloacetate decarboxylase gamma subunit
VLVAEQLVFIVQGFGLVVAGLALLWLVSALLGRVFAERPRATPAGVDAPATAPAPAVTPGVPAAHVAAIAAAVAVATSGRGRVVRVVAPAHLAAGWVGAGRSQLVQGQRPRSDWRQPRLAAVRVPSSSHRQENARP